MSKPRTRPLHELPHALDNWEALAPRLRGRPVAVFVDYDGTLTPVVARPEQAQLDPTTRERLAALARRVPVAVVTGRGLDDVRRLVDLPQLVYAASHGFDLAGPGLRHQPDPAIWPQFDAAAQQLRAATATIHGVLIEPKGFSVTLHYRLVDPADVPQVEAAVDAVIARWPDIRKGWGKKAFELRPAADWHKGAAIGWILDQLAQPTEAPTPHLPLFIGDDRTDEDAHAVVQHRGIGIFVGERCDWDTAATYRLQDPTEVHHLLQRLLDLPVGTHPAQDLSC